MEDELDFFLLGRFGNLSTICGDSIFCWRPPGITKTYDMENMSYDHSRKGWSLSIFQPRKGQQRCDPADWGDADQSLMGPNGPSFIGKVFRDPMSAKVPEVAIVDLWLNSTCFRMFPSR